MLPSKVPVGTGIKSLYITSPNKIYKIIYCHTYVVQCGPVQGGPFVWLCWNMRRTYEFPPWKMCSPSIIHFDRTLKTHCVNHSDNSRVLAFFRGLKLISQSLGESMSNDLSRDWNTVENENCNIHSEYAEKVLVKVGFGIIVSIVYELWTVDRGHCPYSKNC